ncbi:cwf18 domain containing protein [Hirsutella rhossiliensis]
MGSVPPFSTLASASLDREQDEYNITVTGPRPSAQKKVICAKNKESPAGLPSRARVLPTVDYDRPLATTSQTTSKNVRPLTLSSKIPVIRDARPPISDNSYTKRPIRTPHPPTARAMSPEAQLEEICDQMQALDIQASAFRQINIDLWDNDITHDEKDKIAVTTYVAKFIFIVQSGSDQGYDLLGYFQQHFEEWTEDTWDRAPNEYKRALRKLLRKRGIYTEQEFTEMVFDERTAAFRRQTALLGSNASTNPHPSQPPSPSVTPLAAPHQGLNEPQPIKTLTSPPNAPTPAPTIQDKPAPTSLTIHPTSYRFQNPDLVQPVTNSIPEHLSGPATFGEYMKLPPDNIPNAIVDSDIQQKFMKTWNKDRNYTGEPYDLLDDKLRLFLSNCSHIPVKPSQFHALFPRILDGRAQRFYLDKITWATTFRQAYDIFKQHFDTEVNHVHYHTDWTTITFNSIRAQDASKTPHEVLQILFDKLQLCQRALGREYAGDLQLRTTLMKACRGVPELQYALSNPADNVEHLLADLHTDIQVNDPAADTDKATTVETTGLKAVVTTIIATVTETGRRKGCWSTKHSTDERQKAKDQHITQCHFIGVQLTDIGGYILDYEGHEMSSFDDTEDTWEEHDNSTNDHPEQWQASQMLCQQAFNHLITGEDVYQTDQTVVPASQFIIEDRYSRDRFKQHFPQQDTLKDPSVALDSSTSGQASIKFGNSDAIHSSAQITFHVLQTPTPFLLCLADMDRLGIYFNNITDTINCTNHCTNRPTSIPVVRKWGHPWFFLTKDEESISFLTETEIRTLHRRFGHPAVPRLHHLLKQAGHTPRRFKFTLNDDQEFNYEIIVDVMHLGTPQRPVLHVVDSATAFQGARFLPSMSAKDTWETLRTLWIDTYLGPPDTLRHDAGTNFASLEFRNEAKIMGIKCSQVPVETHWSIGKIERYHAPSDAPLTSSMLRLATPLPPKQSFKWLLKQSMIRQDLTVLCLRCLFSAHTLAYLQTRPFRFYPQKIGSYAESDENAPPTLGRKTKVLSSRCKVKFAFGEKDGWQGPFKIASIDTHNITIDTVNGPKSFDRPLYNRICVMIPLFPTLHTTQTLRHSPVKTLTDLPARPEPPAPRKRGRPPGSKNKPKDLIMMAQAEEDAQALSSSYESDNKEITDLVGRGVFQFERYDQMIKGINTKPYEKSRLVIQGHNDFEKTTLLTQSPTIQRAYPQSQTKLSRTILTYLPTELQGKYPNGTIIRVIKPFHWFRTYQQHHLEKLDMSTSTYDSCLLISNTGPDTLGIVGMQTDDTLILGTNNFSTREEEELQRQNFVPSPRLTSHTEQRSKMTTIDPKAIDRHQRYVEERARASYIASIAQPEASFDVSVAAQRLQWQMDHQLRGLTYKPIDLATAKLMVFTDGSFANNKDLSSQLGFVIALFEISGNIVHWSSTNVLASEIYGMANGFDIGISFAMTMKIIRNDSTFLLSLSSSVRIRTLYECLVKLGTTKEKRLMIDIMALRQSYEKRDNRYSVPPFSTLASASLDREQDEYNITGAYPQ